MIITTSLHIIIKQSSLTYDNTYHTRQIILWILKFVTNQSYDTYHIHQSITLTKEQMNKINNIIYQHCIEHYPLQYIFGTMPFYKLDITIFPPVLIPRPETEQWTIDLIDIIKKYNKPLTILDLCTGSGVIGLSIAQAFPQSHIIGIDIADHAISCAEINKKNNNITNAIFLKSDLYDQLPANIQLDIIIANPPYISLNAYNELMPNVKNWEDKNALVANNNGLEIIEKIIRNASNFLIKNNDIIALKIPQLIIEIGYNQENTVTSIFKKYKFKAETKYDYSNHPRAIYGYLI